MLPLHDSAAVGDATDAAATTVPAPFITCVTTFAFLVIAVSNEFSHGLQSILSCG